MPHSQVTIVGGLGPVLDFNSPNLQFSDSNIITSLNDKTNCISNVSYPLPTILSTGEIGIYYQIAYINFKDNNPFFIIVGKTPVICGGFFGIELVTTKCFAFNRHTQSWNVFHDLNELRFGPSSVILPCDGSMMIAGGANIPDTEILVKNHGWKLTSPLPENRAFGCMLAINECEVAYIGGISQGFAVEATTSIFIYNCETKEWRVAEETLSK